MRGCLSSSTTELKTGAKAHPWRRPASWTCFFEAVATAQRLLQAAAAAKTAPFKQLQLIIAQNSPRQLLDMQASSDDVSFEQWLLPALHDPSLPGVIDLNQCTVLRTRPSCLLTAEELRQLKLTLQTNSNMRVLKINGIPYDNWSLNIDGLKEIADTLGKLTALQQLDVQCKIFVLFLCLQGDVLRLRERGMRGVGLCAFGLTSATVSFARCCS